MKPHKPDASKFGWVGSSCPGKAQMRKNVQKQFLPLDRERERERERDARNCLTLFINE